MKVCWPGCTGTAKKTRNAHTILERKIIEEKIMWKTWSDIKINLRNINCGEERWKGIFFSGGLGY